MHLADITIISRGTPPTLIEKPNKNTVNLLSVLLNSRYFNDFVEGFIDEHGIQAVNITPVLNEINEEMWLEGNKFKEISEVVSNLGLSSDFEFDFYLLAKYQAFRDIGSYFSTRYRSNKWFLKVDVVEAEKQDKEFSAITFYNQLSKNDLHKWIDENWEWIEPRMLHLPVNPVVKTDFKDIEMASEIYELENLGKKPSEMLKILSDKYQSNQAIYDILSLEFIKNKLKRFKKLVAEKESKFQKTIIEYE